MKKISENKKFHQQTEFAKWCISLTIIDDKTFVRIYQLIEGVEKLSKQFKKLINK